MKRTDLHNGELQTVIVGIKIMKGVSFFYINLLPAEKLECMDV